jgi:hypothetical protein
VFKIKKKAYEIPKEFPRERDFFAIKALRFRIILYNRERDFCYESITIQSFFFFFI